MFEERFDVILTGATGIVGSHVLYELIDQKLKGKHKGKIIALARSAGKLSAEERINVMLHKDYLPDFLLTINTDILISCIEVIDADISKSNLNQILSACQSLQNVHLIHAAASTNLATYQSAYDENYKINFEGTKNLYEAAKTFVDKFIYISTAFACGIRSEVIQDDYHSLKDVKFRNPYEEIKLKTEKYLVQQCKVDQIKYQILRPGVVVGRLIHKPFYFLPRYNVIYAFASFFHSLLKKNINSPIDIHVHENAQLHLVSVDYVSKTIVNLYKNDAVNQLNIIPQKGCGVNEISSLMDVVGYKNYKFVSDRTAAKDKIESIYQSKVANSFEPYISDGYYEYDNSRLLKLMKAYNMPDVKHNFKKLISFAKNNSFKQIQMSSK